MFGSCVEADGVAKGWAYLSIAMTRQVLPATTAADMVDCFPNLKKSRSFSISLYGDAGARVLAKAWIDKHFFFMRSWMEAGCNDDHTFSQELVDSYREPEELTALASGSDGQLAARIVQIRAIVH